MAFDDHRDLIQARIDAVAPGELFRLKDLVGEAWPLGEDPRNFGKWFKDEVLAERFRRIRWNDERANNHQDYVRVNE